LNRGELYRVYKGSKHDPKKYRIFVVVSRQVFIIGHLSEEKLEELNKALRIALAAEYYFEY